MKLFLHTLLTLIFITTNVFADLTIPPKSVEKQYLYNTPINVNSGFEQGLTGWSVSEASTMVLQTALSNIHSGARSISWNPSVAGTLTSGTFTPNANLGGMLTVECYIKTADADYDLQLYDTTAAAAVQTMDIVTDGADSAFSLNKFVYPMSPSATTRTFQIRLNAPGNESVMYADDCRMYFDASAIPVSVNQVFSAKISSADAVSAETADFINGNCTDATTGEITCTFTTGFFTQTPNCQATADDANSNNNVQITASSATSITILTAGAGTAANRGIVLSCQRSEPNSGFAVRMDQTNFGWQSAGVVSIGATTTPPTKGTVSVDRLLVRRNGQNLEGRIEYKQTGAGAAGSGTYLITLPYGLTIDTNLQSVYTATTTTNPLPNNVVGNAFLSGTASIAGSVVVYDSTRLQIVGVLGTNGAGNTSAQTYGSGSTNVSLNNASATLSAEFSVPISGWTENQSAPLIIGGVTSSYEGTLKIESATVDSSCGSTPCTITRQFGTGITSITRSSAGRYVAVIAAGTFSVAPICQVSAYSSVSINRVCKLDAVTTTTAAGIGCIDSTFGAQDSNFTITCIGPR